MEQEKTQQIIKEIDRIKEENYINAKMFLSLKLIEEHGDWITRSLKEKIKSAN